MTCDQVSEHFRRIEFACHCGCGFAAVDVELLELLEDVRNHFNAPVHVNSGCRCLAHNREVGSKDSSKHVRGIAADIRVEGYSSAEVYKYLYRKYQNQHGLGIYKTFVHVDVRRERKRWIKLAN